MTYIGHLIIVLMMRRAFNSNNYGFYSIGFDITNKFTK